MRAFFIVMLACTDAADLDDTQASVRYMLEGESFVALWGFFLALFLHILQFNLHVFYLVPALEGLLSLFYCLASYF